MTQRARDVNKIVAEFIGKEEGIAVDDLYGLVMKNAGNPAVLWDGGGIHFTEEGAALQGKQVAESIIAAGLPAAGSGPIPPREPIEWCYITSHDANSDKLPRVLLIGDSITMRYASAAQEGLRGKAYVTVLGTSKSLGDPAFLDEVTTACNQYTYAVVHFNVGLHGAAGADGYRRDYPRLLATLKERAPGAKLMWATITPCQGEGGMTQNARAFNKIAAEFVEKEGIPVDDLYGLVMSNVNNPELMWDGGGVHFTEKGAALQGAQVARSIIPLLPAQP